VARIGTTTANNILSSYRNGPVKINAGPNVVQRTSNVEQRHHDTAKKPKMQSSQLRRPASPGIHGKVAEAPYKSYANSLKSNFKLLIIAKIDKAANSTVKEKPKMRGASPSKEAAKQQPMPRGTSPSKMKYKT
jgi:hypothetical protein